VGLIGWLILILSQLGPVVGQAPPACGSRQSRLARIIHRTIVESVLGCHGSVSRAPNLAVYPLQHGRRGRGTLVSIPGSAADGTPVPRWPRGQLLAGSLENGAEASATGLDTSWRRTRDGWERSSQWTIRPERRAPSVHPIVVGLLELLLACAALIGFSEAGDRRPRG